MTVGTFIFFPKEIMSPSLIPIFGVPLLIRWFGVTTQLSERHPGDLQTHPIRVSVCTALASGKLQWEVLFMTMMVKVMIIDSHYYNHHYYLVLINS